MNYDDECVGSTGGCMVVIVDLLEANVELYSELRASGK